jgi:hypothetical protein
MAGFQRSIGPRAIRHADPDSKVHANDVARNNERRALYWLGVEQALEDNHRVLPELGSGLLFVRDRETGDLLQVDGAEHTARMDAWAADLSYYLREVRDEKCVTGMRWMKTRTKGVQGSVVTASP